MHTMVCKPIWLVIFAAAVAQASIAANGDENWPDWRGPTADGRSDATGLPLT